MVSLRLALFGLGALEQGALAQSVVRVPAGSTTLRMVHISDVQYHQFATSCSSVPASPYPCGHTNTTNFIRSVVAAEDPNMMVYTGDVIDGNSFPNSTAAMDAIYGCAIDRDLPFGASLGNHDEETNLLTRDDVMRHVETLKGTLSRYGPVEGSPGNFYVDVLGAGDALVARLVFFDSRIDTVTEMINDAQLDWYENVTASAPAVPSLAFYHIPITEYQTAVDAGIPMSGAMHETISVDGPNDRIFPTLKAGNVVAGFCGHDHTNDFCLEYEGINLCYEGSPGFTAYGNTNVPRRARVTELSLNQNRSGLEAVRSWKRLATAGGLAGEVVDDEELWSASGRPSYAERYPLPRGWVQALGFNRYTAQKLSVSV